MIPFVSLSKRKIDNSILITVLYLIQMLQKKISRIYSTPCHSEKKTFLNILFSCSRMYEWGCIFFLNPGLGSILMQIQSYWPTFLSLKRKCSTRILLPKGSCVMANGSINVTYFSAELIQNFMQARQFIKMNPTNIFWPKAKMFLHI